MNRNDNLFKEPLTPCESHFIWSTNSDFQLKKLQDRIAPHGGEVMTYPTHAHLRMSHGVGDGFTGLHLIKQSGFSDQRLPESEAQGNIGPYRYIHFARKMEERSNNSTQSFTQRFLGLMAEELPEDLAPGFSMAAATDSLEAITEAQMWGNSLALIRHSVESAKAALATTKREWRQQIKDKAERTIAIAKKRKPSKEFRPGALVLSSLGNLENISWIPKISPHQLVMVSSPNDPQSGNVVIWGLGSIQCLTLCSIENHFVLKKKDKFVDIWKRSMTNK